MTREKEEKVATTIQLPVRLHRELESIKDRFGIPHTRMIQRGIALAVREFGSEIKGPVIPQEV